MSVTGVLQPDRLSASLLLMRLFMVGCAIESLVRKNFLRPTRKVHFYVVIIFIQPELDKGPSRALSNILSAAIVILLGHSARLTWRPVYVFSYPPAWRGFVGSIPANCTLGTECKPIEVYWRM